MSSKSPSLGTYVDNGKSVAIDLPRLIVTRMLVTANSGGGKSRALRRLFEQLAGKVQQLILDPEGEFASLREKHDFIICAAQGGDVEAHPRTAALLARRLLETEASAVLDISELKAQERHRFVRLFLEALVNAPKELRHPTLVAVDEAQLFAPEKDESEALGAMVDLATRGRKRGLCMVAATQRMSLLSKAIAAELKNRLIGGISLDVDLKRAAFDLGLTPHEARDVLRVLTPGQFYAFGPALHQAEPRVLLTGDVETTHPEAGTQLRAHIPKPTAAVVALLPKLADLPKEAETEARTIEDLRRELSTTRRELTLAKKAQPAPAPKDVATAARLREVDTELRRASATVKRLQGALETLMKFIVQINATGFAKDAGVDPAELQKAIESAVRQAMKLVDEKTAAREKALQALQREAGRLIASVQKLLGETAIAIEVGVKHQEPFAIEAPASRPSTSPIVGREYGSESNGGTPPVQQKILNALAELEQMCAKAPDRELVAFMSGYSNVNSKGFANAIGALRSAGLINPPSGDGTVALTESGRAQAQLPDAPTTSEELQQRVITMLGGASGRILKPLIDAYPSAMARDSLAEAAGYGNVNSKGFANAIGRLSGLGFVHYPERGQVAAKPVLFLQQ